jgi:ADP-ribosyl-[dinitrogen reductase] hydrolase
MDRFSNWLMYNDYTACGEVFDVGNATSRAIMNYGRGIDPLECGGISEYENGNGSLMRILPIAYYLQKQKDNKMESKMEIVHNVSALTHRHPISLIACGIYVNVALRLLKIEESLYMCVEQGISEAFEFYDTEMPDEADNYNRLRNLSSFSNLAEEEIKSSGYVIDTLEASIWCLLNTNSYKECVLKAVNLGNDTDTVGSVVGGLAGIYYGSDDIPEEWLDVLVRRQYIEELCEKLQKIG